MDEPRVELQADSNTEQAADLASPPNPPLATYVTRHDGWTGEKMAIFCETLAETAVVAEACEAARMGISGAYACRRRNPVFAAAWDAALTIARERLADTLLARSMEGNIELIWRGGEVIGERHVIDNRLGLAILRRLDRLAEGGVCVSARDLPFSGQCRSPDVHRGSFNWEHAIDALKCGDDEGVARALTLIKGDEVEEVEAPRGGHAGGMAGYGALRGGHAGVHEEEQDEPDLSDRCWLDPDSDARAWLTDFPPPPGFTGYQSCEWGDPESLYKRECTAEEAAILEADAAAARAGERAEDEALRDSFFALLKDDLLPPANLLEQPGEPVGDVPLEREGDLAEQAADGVRPVADGGQERV